MELLAIILGSIVLCLLVWFAIQACSEYLAARALRRRQQQQTAEVIVLFDWLDRLSAEQRIEHLQNRARKRKRERMVVH